MSVSRSCIASRFLVSCLQVTKQQARRQVYFIYSHLNTSPERREKIETEKSRAFSVRLMCLNHAMAALMWLLGAASLVAHLQIPF